MRFALLALSIASTAAFAQPSPAVQIGALVKVEPCSVAFPAMASPLADAVSKFKLRVREVLPDELWNRLIEEGRVYAVKSGMQVERAECEDLLRSTSEERLDAALSLLQEDVQLEERANRIRLRQSGGFNTMGVRFRFDTLPAAIEDVREDGPAYQAGIRPGDVLVEFGGAPVTRASYARLAILEAPVGATIPVIVLRDRRRLQFSVALEVSKVQRSPQ